MAILGPDGRPIETGPPVSDEVRKIVEQAKETATQGDPRTALQQIVFAFQNDVRSDLVLDTTCDLLDQIRQLQGVEQSEELEIFRYLRAHRDDPGIYYQVGNRFAQLQQPFVARPFLVRAKELLKGELNQISQAVDVDHAQVMMDLGDYEQAIAAFHNLNDTYGGLPIWLLLEMAECYALLRQVDEAEAVYQIATPEAASQIEGMENALEEVGDLLARARDFDERQEIGLRGWHYIQTRGILIETNPDENVPGGRFIFFQPSPDDVAYVVGVTAALLDSQGYAPNRILWLGETSEPLARLFGEWWEIKEEDLRPYQPGDNTNDEGHLALLVMAHSYDMGELPDEEALVDLAQAREGMITFALDLRWTERQPITPDIAGFLSQACNLPWEPRFQVNEEEQTVTRVEDERDAKTVASEMAQQFPEEKECDEWAKELLEEYSVCTDLILNHRDGSLQRRPLVTHSPVRSPRFGF